METIFIIALLFIILLFHIFILHFLKKIEDIFKELKEKLEKE
jgi:hypothetical protein